jgi:hypothetical protein
MEMRLLEGEKIVLDDGYAGFQKFDEVNGIHVYRRPKKYNS